MLLIPLKLLKSKRDSVRKAREAHLIQKAKTVELYVMKSNPIILKVVDCYYLQPYSLFTLDQVYK